MYSPDSFQMHDRSVLDAFIRRHGFATVVTCDGETPQATHLPVLLETDRGPHGMLVFHLAKVNPQWRQFATGQPVLVIFTGPHAYISPAWYVTEPAVPTWNYTAVHVYGVARLVTDPERCARMLHDLVEFYEAGRDPRWHGSIPVEYRDRLLQGIVGVEVEITRVEGKFKLSQNRPQDLPGVIAALAASGDPTDREVAELMAQQRSDG